MRFLADENLRSDIVRWLIELGHDVKFAPRRFSDFAVANLAKKEKRILLTNDADFTVTLVYPPGNYAGIVVFRLHPPRFEKYKTALENFFAVKTTGYIKGKTFIIKEGSFVELESIS